MKILQIHNYYQRPGGEDRVVAAERELLQSYGHEVEQYIRHNDQVEETSRLQLVRKTIYNSETEQEIRELLDREPPDIIHAHNTFPLISPSLYYAAAQARIPVVQTLHNFRLLCPSATLFRNGKICEDCVGRVPYAAVIHSCYRGNRAASLVAASMITAHRVLGTWRNKIHTYIALSEFSKTKFVEGGLAAGKIAVKTNFLAEDPGVGDGAGGFALFAGRLSREKGLGVLLDAWERLDSAIPLKIAGDGELMPWLVEQTRRVRNVEVLGHCERGKLLDLLRRAAVLIMPSEWYEAGVPLAIIEAFGCGTPVLTSRLPSMDEVIADGFNGDRFAIGSAEELAKRLQCLWRSSELPFKMRQAARASYQERYTPAANYPILMKIYQSAIASFGRGQTVNSQGSGSLPVDFRSHLSPRNHFDIGAETKQFEPFSKNLAGWGE